LIAEENRRDKSNTPNTISTRLLKVWTRIIGLLLGASGKREYRKIMVCSHRLHPIRSKAGDNWARMKIMQMRTRIAVWKQRSGRRVKWL